MEGWPVEKGALSLYIERIQIISLDYAVLCQAFVSPRSVCLLK